MPQISCKNIRGAEKPSMPESDPDVLSGRWSGMNGPGLSERRSNTTRDFQTVKTAMYKAQAESQQGAPNDADQNKDAGSDDVEDVDFEEVKED